MSDRSSTQTFGVHRASVGFESGKITSCLIDGPPPPFRSFEISFSLGNVHFLRFGELIRDTSEVILFSQSLFEYADVLCKERVCMSCAKSVLTSPPVENSITIITIRLRS